MTEPSTTEPSTNGPTTATPAPSARTRIRRIAENADYQRSTLYAILDAAYVCHIAFADAQGTHNIPTACWRSGEYLYIHGSNGGRLLKLLAGGTPACVAISHVDGLVLARSAFNHSMNYRSAVVYGTFERVAADADKRAAMDAFMDHIAPGRNADIRQGSAKEFAATTVMRIALDEAVCKVRTGPPVDDAEDMAIPAWTGVLPLVQTRAAPVVDAAGPGAMPGYVRGWAEVATV